MGSSRLPGKTLLKINKKITVLNFVINQLSYSKLIDTIIVATTNLKEDDPIEDFVKKLNIDIFRGNENDVLDRYFQCTKKFSIDTIVRITADNPLIDYEIVDTVVEHFKSNNYDYITIDRPQISTFHQTYPWGYNVEVFTFSALENAWKNAKLLSEREHVTHYFYKNNEIFKQTSIENSEDLSRFRCTVNTKYDLELIQKIYSNIKKRPILLHDVIKLLKADPELVKINAHIKDH